jgi:hypothetical protein
MASACTAILIMVVRLLLLWLRRGRWARTPWALLLRGGRTVMVRLYLIGLRRHDALTRKRVVIRVGHVVGLGRI